jgi:hypothetical protein
LCYNGGQDARLGTPARRRHDEETRTAEGLYERPAMFVITIIDEITERGPRVPHG